MTGRRPAERPSPCSGPGLRAERAPSQISDRPAPPVPGAASGLLHPENVPAKPAGNGSPAGHAGQPRVAQSGKTTGKPGGGAGKPGGKPGAKAKRPALISDHFALTWRRADPARRGALAAPVATHRAPRLMMAVAKKLLPRAIDRNTVRRVTREAWRAVAARHPDLDLFVRLQSKPQAWSALPDGQRKRACRIELDALLARLPAGGPR